MPFGRSHTCLPFITPKTSLPEPAGTRPEATGAPGLAAIPACFRSAVARVRGLSLARTNKPLPASIFRRAAGSLCFAAALLPSIGAFFCSVAVAQTAHFAGAQSVIANKATNGLYCPRGVAVDGSGNVYIADWGNSRVLKETLAAGSYTQSVVAVLANGANGTSEPWGVAVDGSGTVYISDYHNFLVLKETPSAGGYTQSVVANNASNGLVYPQGVAVDGRGNVYIADSFNNRVLKETPSAEGYTQSVVANSANNGLAYPYGVAVDGGGNVYIGEDGDPYHVLKETPSAGGYTQSVVADNGQSYYTAVAVDRSGNVYFGDSYNNQVLKETLSAGSYTQSVVATNGLYGPEGVAVDGSGNVYIADAGNNRVLKETSASGNFGTENVGSASPAPVSMIFAFDAAETLGSTAVVTQGAAALDFTDAGSGTCTAGGAYTAGEACAVDVAFAPARAGTRYGAAQLLNGSGNVIATGYVQGTGVGPQVVFLPGMHSTVASGLSDPLGVAVVAGGNVYIADSKNNQVLKETPSAGGYTQSIVADAASGGLDNPTGVAVDGSGNVYIADTGNSRVLLETLSAGSYTQSTVASAASGGLSKPTGIAVDGSGNVYFTDRGLNQVLKESLSAGSYTQSVIVSSGLSKPTGLAVDGSGNVYFADSNNNRVLMEALSAGGYTQSIVADAASGGLNGPSGVAVDGTGSVYIADSGNSRVLKETPSAGGYTQLVIVDATSGGPSDPSGVAVDGGGNVYIADDATNLVLIENFSYLPGLTFPATLVGNASSPQTITLENIGNAPLTFPVPATGDNPSVSANYTLDNDGASTCPITAAGSSTAGTLGAGASCLLPISFTPVSTGSIGGTLTLTDNNLNAASPNYATQSSSLSGTATSSSTPAPAELVSPVPDSTFAGSSVTFTWSAGIGVTKYQLWLGTTGVGSYNLYASGQTKATTVTVNNLPTYGVTVFARLWSEINGAWQSADYTYTESGTPVAPVLTTPKPGSVLAGSSVAFTWTAGGGPAAYQLYLGTTGVGSYNLYASGPTTATTKTVNNLPTDGVTVFARLLWEIDGAWVSADYTYTEAGTLVRAALTSPTPGSTLTGSSATFTWTAGAGPAEYQLWLGTNGVGSYNVYNSGPTTATTETVNNLPTYGVTLYAQLYQLIDGKWQATQYTYMEAGTPVLAALTSPTPGSTLAGSSVTFTWSPGGGPLAYQLRLGTIGVGSYNLYVLGTTKATTVTVNTLPTDGVTVYARLFSLINGKWQSADYTYTEAGTLVPAALNTPTPGSTLSGSTVSFGWSGGAGPAEYQLYLGTTGVGSYNLYVLGATTHTSVTVNGLPTDGATVFARLFQLIDGAWQHADYTYTEAGTLVPAALTSPPPGSVLAGSSVTFTWTGGAGPAAYQLYLGTTGVGSYNIYDSGSTTATSETVNDLPTNGVKVYARLYQLIDGVWQHTDYTYTASGT